MHGSPSFPQARQGILRDQQKDDILPSEMRCRTCGFKATHSWKALLQRHDFFWTSLLEAGTLWHASGHSSWLQEDWVHGWVWSVLPTLFQMARPPLITRDSRGLKEMPASQKEAIQVLFVGFLVLVGFFVLLLGLVFLVVVVVLSWLIVRKAVWSKNHLLIPFIHTLYFLQSPTSSSADLTGLHPFLSFNI